MDRREFLRLGAIAGAAFALAPACGSGSDASAAAGGKKPRDDNGPRSKRADSVLNGAAAESGIDTIVIVMMENRSFDSYFGWLARDAGYLEAGKSLYGSDFTLNGNSFQSFAAPDGTNVETARRVLSGEANPWRGCGHPDPGHGWVAGRAQRDGGFLAEGSGNDEFALSYFEGEDLPIYAALARRFTVCDQWHASCLGPTYPNREYLLSAQSGGNKTNFLPLEQGGFQWPTIIDRLSAANVTVSEYYSDLPQLLLWGGRMIPFTRVGARFHEDAAAGKLPQVSIITPAFVGGNRTDDHPHGDPRAAQRFVRDAFASFATSPQWERGLFVLTYDEWGGFFDHVAPPRLKDDRASSNDDNDFAQAGFRVPTVLASPRAQRGLVDHAQYDHTSVLRFLEWRFLGAPPRGPGNAGPRWYLTQRDRYANNLGETLMRESSDADVGFDVNVAIPAPSAPCADATALVPLEPTPFELARDLGYYERVGLLV
jgi:phospholipase C